MKILFSLDNYDHDTGEAEMSIQALAHQMIYDHIIFTMKKRIKSNFSRKLL